MRIQRNSDIAKARNVCRTMILSQRLPLALCARGVAAITSLGELILLSSLTGTLEVRIIPQNGKQGVELRCIIPLNGGQPLTMDTTQGQLARAVDSLDIYNNDQQIVIVSHLWAL
ncbi:MAG TPA: hypothetical protein VKQ72_15210 [Aggregatilineales bacterium]|nr:hypothetical protein [Aggregatilineales bacterium]